MKSKKIIQRFVAIVIIISLITQDFPFTAYANSNDDNVETVYVDGIEFNVVENGEGLEINGEYEKNTGLVIIETLEKNKINPMYTPGILCKNHGPFTWGKDAGQAVYNAVVLEEVAKMAFYTELINPKAGQAPDSIQKKHFYRKHGADAYYGQDA